MVKKNRHLYNKNFSTIFCVRRFFQFECRILESVHCELGTPTLAAWIQVLEKRLFVWCQQCQQRFPQHFFLDDDSVPELEGSRPDRLADVRPQERVPRRIVEQIVDSAPVLPLLHAPVPQTVVSVGEVLKILDVLVPDVEQVNEVPKIIQHTVPQRSSLLEPQMAEQLAEVSVIEHVGLAPFLDAWGLGFMRISGWYTNTGKPLDDGG